MVDAQPEWANWDRQVEPVVGDASVPLYIGRSTLVVSLAQAGPYGVVFEDDGVAGLLYGLDRRRGEGVSAVVDYLLIYQVVRGQAEQGVRNQLDVVWTADGRKAALLINSQAYAFYAFDLVVASARSGQPSAQERGYTETHDWQQGLFERYWPAYVQHERPRW
jgi:hypothetical protein